MEYVIVFALIGLSALFSGLTLGLLSLDVHTLKRQMELGIKEAGKIYPIRKKGNLLLTTLLLGNVAVNSALSIYLNSLVSGVVAGVSATALIFVFGEIVPQAVISRYALWFGAKTAWLVRFFIILLYPLTYPIAWILDKLLGEEIPKIYSKHELMKIISEHEDSEHSPIDQDEERIVHGALMFSQMTVAQVMTPLNQVVMYEDSQVLDESLRKHILHNGVSRSPIYHKERTNIVGILYSKDLLIEDEDVPIREAHNAFETNFLVVSPKEMLDTVLTKMLKSKMHMGIVLAKEEKCVGVITLEDIIEEIIQHEIEDEDDY